MRVLCFLLMILTGAGSGVERDGLRRDEWDREADAGVGGEPT